MEEQRNLIEIKGAYKRYGHGSVILKGLNMSVGEGTIYGLLGPSGCGKTTLLGCVAGYQHLDAGSITVDLDSKTQLGYMPQEIALLEPFTVAEMLTYFGKLNNCSSDEITKRGKTLLGLMDLSVDFYWERVIGTLSGGQKRRISLAVALIHDPELLILDEPTVGLDPLISQRLWEYFLEITAQENKTIIITTHYIEEARHSHKIGLMRNGKLLAEAPPLQLLADHTCETLEDVFLLLSHRQIVVCEENGEDYPKSIQSKPPLPEENLWVRNRIAAQIYKNICWTKRNVPMQIFMLTLPALLMLLFCVVYSDSLNGVVIAAVSDEVLPESCLGQRPQSGAEPRCKKHSRFSCQYLRLVREKSYIIKEYQDLPSALQSVIKGESRALMHFDKTYSWSLIRRITEGPITPDRYVNSSAVDVYIDRAEMTIGFKIDKDIRDSFLDLVQLIFKECGFNLRAAQTILRFENPVYGESSPKFTWTAIPGYIIPLTFYLSTIFSATSYLSEKTSGFLQRCLISGVQYTEVMFAHAVIQMLMLTGQNVLLLTIAYGFYNLPLEGSWYLIILLIVVAEVQGMFYGFILGTSLDEESSVNYAATATVICLFLSCGMFWPIEGVHWILQLAVRYSPIVMAVESYRSVTIRGWGISHSSLIVSMVANIGLLALFIFVFFWITRAKK